MTTRGEYIFGPVPSRRLGLSLGVDIIPFKVCPLDCIYCQLGRTTEKTIERKEYVDVEQVLSELRDCLAGGVKADFVTLSGSGEPTLNIDLGRIIDGIKKLTDIPVAVLTNGVLFSREDVRRDCAKADMVAPSLDAVSEDVFAKINRPCDQINVATLIDGLCAFRNEFAGKIWLEVFFVEGLNTSPEEIAKIKQAIFRIRPDKIHINTAVRPTAEAGVKRIEAEKLKEIASQLGENCEIIADFGRRFRGKHVEAVEESVLSMLKRRPCSLDDICCGLGIGKLEALKYIELLSQNAAIISESRDGVTFFKAC